MMTPIRNDKPPAPNDVLRQIMPSFGGYIRLDYIDLYDLEDLNVRNHSRHFICALLIPSKVMKFLLPVYFHNHQILWIMQF